MITLFEKEENCCGCGACANVCPKKAITMKENEYGFIHPFIDEKLCIECGLCKKVCNFQNKLNYSEEHIAYAAVTKDMDILMKSTSGGVFTTIAKAFLEDGGYISGAVYDEDFNVKHIVSNKYEDLLKMQGSKYVQSSIDSVYKEIKQLLNNNEKVLFSGTPCQVDGLYGYLLKDYDTLYTIDIVCHGVPSNKMFQDYLKTEVKNNEIIKSITFRDKSQTWGTLGRIKITGYNGNRFVDINNGSSTYYYLFNHNLAFRDSCYKCKYASKQRPADITMGDYWGIESVHPELLKEYFLDEKKGISLLVLNTKKGKDLYERKKTLFNSYSSTIENASKHNYNLNNPSNYSDYRDVILIEYATHAYGAIKNLIKKGMWKDKIKLTVKKLIPHDLKQKLKRLIN